jgi:PmbA protein
MLKEKKELESLASFCIDNSIKSGATDCEVKIGNIISETANLRNKRIENSDRSDILSININTYINKKKSSTQFTYTDNNNTNLMIEKCVEVTKLLPEDKFNSLPKKKLLAKNVEDLFLFDESTINNEKKLEYLKEVEDAALNNKFISQTNGSSFNQSKSNYIVANSDGFLSGYKKSEFSSFTDLIAKKDTSNMERDYDYDSKIYLKDLIKPKDLGNSAAKLAVRKINPKKTKTESIPIIFEKRISKNILRILSSAISGSSFARGSSFLKKKLNKKIFPKNINIIDDPLIKKSVYSMPFDKEGVKSEKIYLVKDGILNNIILNTYYAKMLNTESNGRASGLSNTFFEKGKYTYENLFDSNKNLILVTDIMGAFGNATTGEFSCGATGIYYEKNGHYPINNFTLGGKIENIFNNIVLANDLEFKYSQNCPTALITEGIVVGGS